MNVTIRDKNLLSYLNSIHEKDAKKIIFQANVISYIDNRFIYKKDVSANKHFVDKVIVVKDSLTFEDVFINIKGERKWKVKLNLNN